MTPLTLLIDADYFVYRAASASEMELDYSQDLTVVVGDFEKGKRIVLQELKKLTTKFDTKELLLCFTAPTNFRKGVLETYKGNRTKRKPAGYVKLRRWCIENYPSMTKPGLEADDVLGILATKGDLENFIVISPDKDMQQLPCRLYDLKTEYTQTEEAAVYKLYEQALTGDQVDGYSGCPGIGPKRASVILAKVKDQNYWPAVVEAYKNADLTEEDALTSIRLARILQVTDWDAERQTPILFTPNGTSTDACDGTDVVAGVQHNETEERV